MLVKIMCKIMSVPCSQRQYKSFRLYHYRLYHYKMCSSLKCAAQDRSSVSISYCVILLQSFSPLKRSICFNRGLIYKPHKIIILESTAVPLALTSVQFSGTPQTWHTSGACIIYRAQQQQHVYMFVLCTCILVTDGGGKSLGTICLPVT